MYASDGLESGMGLILYSALLNINETMLLLDYKRETSSIEKDSQKLFPKLMEMHGNAVNKGF